MNKYLSSMKKNYIYGILIILLIASIILGYFLYKEKKNMLLQLKINTILLYMN